ncbi:MAG: SPFH domain-containing protein [Nanoarchaeota archaeon]
MSTALIVILSVAGAIGLLYYFHLLVPVLLIMLAGFLTFIFFRVFLKRYDPYEAAVIYRFGRFHRINSGWTVVLPVVEKVGGILDLREQQEHISIPVISKEGLKINIMALVYFYVHNAKSVILNVQDYRNAFVDLIESSIRDIAADFNFTQLMVNVEHVSELLKQRMAPELDKWGLTLSTLEIEHIRPPESVMEALEAVKVSEQNLEAKKFVAEARRIVTRALGEGTKSFDDKTITYLYVKALENMKSAKMLLPAEFMDVVHGSGNQTLSGGSNGGSNRLASGMIAGTTFNKALNMITDEVTKEVVPPAEQKKETAREKDNRALEEEGAAGFDGLDGSYDGHFDEKKA